MRVLSGRLGRMNYWFTPGEPAWVAKLVGLLAVVGFVAVVWWAVTVVAALT